MASVVIRNLSEATHRALRARAAAAGRSTEAEIRAILENATRPKNRVKLGSLLAEIGRELGGVELEIERDKAPNEPADFGMILLDTNVISEPMRANGNTNVLAWIDAQSVETLFLSTISLAELRFGVAALPQGKRREALHNGLELRILPLFTNRILSFDDDASKSYAVLRARAKAEGKAIAPIDGYVAAIAAAHGLIVATRDVAPFLAAGLKVVNPWDIE